MISDVAEEIVTVQMTAVELMISVSVHQTIQVCVAQAELAISVLLETAACGQLNS